MTFKITAKEKAMILKRRKTTAISFSPEDIKRVAENYANKIEKSLGFDYLNMLVETEETDNVPIPADLSNAVRTAVDLQDNLLNVLEEISNGNTFRRFSKRPLEVIIK